MAEQSSDTVGSLKNLANLLAVIFTLIARDWTRRTDGPEHVADRVKERRGDGRGTGISLV